MSYVSHAITRTNRLGTQTRFQLELEGSFAGLVGTIDASTSSTTITGTDTLFLADVAVGDYLYVDDNRYIGRVAVIASNTVLLLEENSAVILSLADYYVAPTLPLVSDGRINFELSRGGFGFANANYRATIVDDGTFIGLFDSNEAADVAMRVLVGADQIFFGRVDFEQIRELEFPELRRGLDVTFYQGVAYGQNARYYDAIYAAFVAGLSNDGASGAFLRFDRFFADFVFSQFNGTGQDISYAHRWLQQTAQFNTGTIQPYQLLNEMWFNPSGFSGTTTFPDDATVNDVMILMSRAFFFRYGWSYSRQANAVMLADTGLIGAYNEDRVTGPIVTYSGGTGSANVRTMVRTARDIQVLERLKFTEGTVRTKYPPFASVTYSRVGPDRTADGSTVRNATQEVENTRLTKPELYDTYKYGTIPFDPSETSSESLLYILSLSGPNLHFSHPLRFIDPTVSATVPYDLPWLNARVHLRMRQSLRVGLTGTYLGLLDPMIPYATDYNGYFYNIVKGSWDVLDCVTEIDESISFGGTYDMAVRYVGASEIFDLDRSDVALRPMIWLRKTTSTVLYLLRGFDTTTSGSDELIDTWRGIGSGTSTGTSRPRLVSGIPDFDGSNDFIEIPHNANQLLTTGGTIMAWIRPDTIPSSTTQNDGARIIDKTNGLSAQNGYNMLVFGSNRLGFRINNGTNRAISNVLTTGEWQHIAVTFTDAGDPTFYVNGVSVGTTAATGAASGITTTNAMRIGNRATATDRPFDGLISDVLVSNSQWTASEIASYYAATQANYL
jgi:hypothetical protein